MTLEEAQLVGRIASTADGGCSSCVGGLFERLNEAFPAFVWVTTDDYWSVTDPEDDGWNLDSGLGFEVRLADA